MLWIIAILQMWDLALWALNSFHSVFSTEAIYVFNLSMHRGVHGTFKSHNSHNETFNANLGLFSKFLSHCHFPFYPHSFPPPSWSLYHCHSHTNLPAIAASPRTTFLTANLCSGRTHPSSGSLRCAAPSPAAPPCTPSRTDPQLRTVCDSFWTLLTKYSQAGTGRDKESACPCVS